MQDKRDHRGFKKLPESKEEWDQLQVELLSPRASDMSYCSKYLGLHPDLLRKALMERYPDTWGVVLPLVAGHVGLQGAKEPVEAYWNGYNATLPPPKRQKKEHE